MGPEDARALAARAVTDSLARAGGGAAERAARVEECVRGLEAEKAKMEAFRRELPVSVRLVADVIEWLKDELAQLRCPAPELFAPVAAQAKTKAAPDGGRTEADDKRSWMSSAQLWSCGSLDDSTGNSNGAKKAAHKVLNASMPLNGLPAMARSTDAAATPLPDLSLSSPAMAVTRPAAPSATSSAVTDAGAQRHPQAQRKARRCWSPELHRRFVAALQRLGGAQVATPKQIRELMKVDGLTNDEVKSHLQKYRLHTRRASSSDGGDVGQAAMAPEQQCATSQHSTSQSGSPQGPLQLTLSSQGAASVTGGDSCDGDEEDEDGKSEGYNCREMQRRGTKTSSS